MSIERLQQQLNHLYSQLSSGAPLSAEERSTLETLCTELEKQLTQEQREEIDESLIDGINLAVDRFEIEHPALAATLRNIVQALGSMGI